MLIATLTYPDGSVLTLPLDEATTLPSAVLPAITMTVDPQ